jgi:sterol desaturase/sphingolipid hydroxylase (fatty acid hydroxylase superfamily)
VLLRNPLALVFLAALFIPLERVWALRKAPLLRAGWQTDVVHFFATHVVQQLALVIAMGLVVAAVDPLVSRGLQDAVAAQPASAQFVEAILLVEFLGYGMHRAFHAFPCGAFTRCTTRANTSTGSQRCARTRSTRS